MTTTNTYGRQIVIPLTNKSGGSVAAGDVVVVDTANNDAFTTDTSGGFTGGVGVAQETIANNAIGRVLIGGYAALVNVNASVTRGQYGKTHTVAKQATGTSVRGVGTFCQWLTGGTTPDALVYPVDLLGSSLTDPTTTRGDIITRGASAIGRLAMATAGKFLSTDGTDAAYIYPPGYEFDYVQITADVTITATSEATATTVVTGNAVTYDGSTIIMVEYWFPFLEQDTNTNSVIAVLYDGSSSIGLFGILTAPATGNLRAPAKSERRLTPSAAAHTFSIRAYKDAGTAKVGSGTGGSGNHMPGFIRVRKV